jgi:ferredoxin
VDDDAEAKNKPKGENIMTNNTQEECPICMAEIGGGYCPTCDMEVDEDAYYGGLTDEDYAEQERYEAEDAAKYVAERAAADDDDENAPGRNDTDIVLAGLVGLAGVVVWGIINRLRSKSQGRKD